MANEILKVKAKASGGKTQVKMMAKHIMESGQRKDKNTGEAIPALFLQNLVVKHNDKVVFEANLGPAISKNPYLAFDFDGGASGDQLVMTWTENSGMSATETAEIK